MESCSPGPERKAGVFAPKEEEGLGDRIPESEGEGDLGVFFTPFSALGLKRVLKATSPHPQPFLFLPPRVAGITGVHHCVQPKYIGQVVCAWGVLCVAGD